MIELHRSILATVRAWLHCRTSDRVGVGPVTTEDMVSETDVPRAARQSARGIPAVAAGLRRRRCWRWLSGCVTYAMLTGLTPYHPEPHRADRAAAGQPDPGAVAGGADRLAAGAAVGDAPIGPRRRQAACAAGDLVLRHRGGARDPGRDLRRGDLEPRPGGLVLRPGEGRAGQRGQRRPALCQGA